MGHFGRNASRVESVVQLIPKQQALHQADDRFTGKLLCGYRCLIGQGMIPGQNCQGSHADKRLTTPARIVGCDLNPAMIRVARANTPDGPHRFEWIEAPAQSMPLKDGAVDLAFCQHGLQFFPDKPAALAEIRKIVKTDALVVVTCWSAIPPFFAVVADVLKVHIGDTAATTAVQPFTWNDADEVRELIGAAGFNVAAPKTISVDRKLRCDAQAMRDELLSTPNEKALRAAGEEATNVVASEILKAVTHFRDGEFLIMPQKALLFEAVAR